MPHPIQDLQAVPPVALDLESEDDPYAEDRELVEICNVCSLSDALQVQRLLDSVYVPFFMGPERATRAEAVTSNFSNGVSVQVIRIGVPWARQALQHYEPADEPPDEKCNRNEDADFAVRCPKCHSKELVFEELVSETATATCASPPKYKWTCDSCGHEWQDEGIQTKG